MDGWMWGGDHYKYVAPTALWKSRRRADIGRESAVIDRRYRGLEKGCTSCACDFDVFWRIDVLQSAWVQPVAG